MSEPTPYEEFKEEFEKEAGMSWQEWLKSDRYSTDPFEQNKKDAILSCRARMMRDLEGLDDEDSNSK